MGYILKYFDDFISQEPFYGAPISPKKIELYEDEEIRRRGTEVVDFLRDKYYSEQEEGVFILFRRLFKRLLSLIKVSVEIINDQQEELVLYWQKHSVHFKEYYAVVKINEELSIFLDLFLKEFDLKGVEGFEFDENDASYELRPFQHREAVFYHYNLELVNSLRNNQDITSQFKKTFPSLAQKLDFIYEHKDMIIGIFADPHDNGFISIPEEELLQPFWDLDLLEGEESNQIYQNAISFIKREVSLFTVQEEKERFILSFYMHIGCCKDLVVRYVKKAINQISNMTSKNQDIKINEFIKWYDTEMKFPKYDNYRDTFYKSQSVEIKKEVENLLGKYRTGLMIDQKGDDLEKNVAGEKIQYTGTLESLGLLTYLMFNAGIIFDDNNVERVARVLSASYLVKLNKPFAWSTVKGYFLEGGRANDDKNVPFLIDKFTQMLNELKKMKKDYEYK